MLKALILLCDLLVAAALVWVLNRWGLGPFRRSNDAHWTERARVLYPARVGAAMSIWLVPANIAVGQSLVGSEAMPPLALAALAAWLGSVLGTHPFDRETLPWLKPRDWVHHVAASWVIRFAVWFAFIGITAVMPVELDWRSWLLATLFVGLFLAWCWGGLLWVCRTLGLLAPAPERLRRIVCETSARMGVPVRGVWLLRSAASQAFALPYTGDLLFTGRLLERQPDDEIAAICAHELGHLAETKLIVAARVLANVAWLVPLLFAKPLVHSFDLPAIPFLVVGSVGIMFGGRQLSRRLEQRADRVAHANEGETGAYARALARLYEDNLIPAVLPRRLRSHPDLYDRLLAVGVQPDFVRPKPPRSIPVHAIALLVLLWMLLSSWAVQRFS